MPAERERFEPRLGLELSAVRVHTGPRAASLAADQRSHAFAYGSHIVLGSQAQRAAPGTYTRVLAHELVHVGQQAAPAAAHSSSRARAPPALRPAPLGVQRLDGDSILPSWVSEAAGAAVDIGAEALETASELPGRAVDVVGESAAAIVEALAPGLLDLLNNGAVARMAELFCTGLDTLVGRYFETLGEIDFMSTIEQTFRGLANGVGALRLALGTAASAALGTLLEPLVDGLQAWGGPVIRTLQEVAALVNGVFSGLWDNLAVPALDFLGSVGGAVWDSFSALVSLLWRLTEPIREAGGIAWTFLKEQFDLAWNSESDVGATLSRLAGDAWADFLTTIEPIRRPLEIAGGVLLLLSPLGPIIVLSQVIPPLWEKITWLWNNWNSEDILVAARTVLTEDVLPGIFSAVGGVASALAGATAWLSDVTGQLSAVMTSVLGAFGGSRCLRAVTTYLNGVSAQFTRLAAWAASGFEGLGPALRAVMDALVAILRPILDFLIRLGMLAINPGMLPIVLTAAIWLLCPDRLKPPVIRFVYDLLIAFIEAFPELLLLLGPLASVIKAGILGYLRHLRGGEGVTDRMRIDVSNKVANIAAGGGLEFVGGFAYGLLQGLIDGIIDPFRLIFMLGQVLVAAGAAIGRALAPYALQAIPGFLPAVQPGAAAPATPASVPETPGGARAPPLASFEPEPILQSREPSDAQIVASLSPATAGEFAAVDPEGPIDAAALEESARAEATSQGATVSGLGELLGDAWSAILAGAERIGAMIAGALLRFILQPDFELGRQLGFVAGFVLLQALIIYLSAGGYAALKGVEPVLRQLLVYLLRFLDLGGELFAVLGRALKPLKGPILAGLSAIRRFLNRFAFARALLERIERLAARVFRFGDEAAAAVPATGAGAADTAVSRVAAETTETATRESGERAARDALQTGEQAVAGKVDDVGEGTLRAADEPGVPTLADDALKAAQFAEAQIAARAIASANDAVDTPIEIVLGELTLLKRRYRWIDAFFARPRGPRRYRIVFTATPEHNVWDYEAGPRLELDEMSQLLPGVSLHTPARQRGIELLNQLPDSDSQFLLDALAKLAKTNPAAVEQAMARLGRVGLDPADVLAFTRARRGFVPKELEAVAELQRSSGQTLEEATEAFRLFRRPTRRVDPTRIRAGRQALRREMPEPIWANGDGDLWNAHHIIPVELQDHWVFEILTSRPPGWNHHDPRINGIALPTTIDAATRSGLPVHQVTPEVLDEARRLAGVRDARPPGVVRDLQGHPIVNQDVKAALDALEDYADDPVELRRQVLLIRDRFLDQIVLGRSPVLF